ncbi:MAG TPA: phytanoyl-CoA dioxygenase family protein [Acidimicrobiia bacterium]|nr:phytanoyl-CoA dioxygenase family protein [Acidimicrobiia bacterium]
MQAGLSERGFIGPTSVLEPSECRALLSMISDDPAPLDWIKGRAATSRLIYEVATRREVLDPVEAVLGPNVLLWGASLATRDPGAVHPPHVDIETSASDSRAVSVWIGLENTVRESALWLVGGSHRFGETIQQVAAAEGRRRGEYGRDDLLVWARRRDPAADLVHLDMGDGQAVWFDGRLWHGSDNQSGRRRTALLLQYAAAETPIRIPDLTVLEHPFRLETDPRPPCIVVAGDGHGDVNRIVPPPPPARTLLPALSSWVRELELPLGLEESADFTPHHIFRGSTPNTVWLSCHASALAGGASPHEPHTHDDDEVLVVLEGEAELIIGDDSDRRTVPAPAGTLAWYPSGFPHTLRGAGDRPVNYLMLKWTSAGEPVTEPMPAGVFDLGGIRVGGDGGFRHAPVLDGGSAQLSRLECHLSELDPGAGYDPHVDAHDVAILLLAGSVETLGVTVAAPAIVFTAGGWPHGIHNSGDEIARYAVFEFHGRGPLISLAGGPFVASPPPVPDRGPEPPTQSLVRRARVGAWSTGGRLLRRFPRLKSALRAVLGRLSPWR